MPGGSHRRVALAATLAVTLLCGLAPAVAQAKVALCVSFIGPTLERPQEYRRLLEQELRHHPTHRVVARGCEAELVLEYIRLEKTAVLTGRLRGGVPHRVKVERVSALPARMREVVSFLLEREPVYLVENLETSGLLNRPRQSLLKHGRNLYGLEIHELFVFTRQTRASLPGLAFRFRRTVDRWYLGAVAAFAFNPRPLPRDEGGAASLEGHFFRFAGAARFEAGVNFFSDAPASLLVSGLAGVSFMHLYGPDAAGGVNDIVGALMELSARVGVELFRLYAFRLTCHGQVNLPLHPFRDEDYGLIDDYTPSVELGCGVAF
jgi:hypothetical protein